MKELAIIAIIGLGAYLLLSKTAGTSISMPANSPGAGNTWQWNGFAWVATPAGVINL